MERGIKMTNKKMGRPRKEIDWDMFEKLCEFQATEEEIASFFKCSTDTLNTHCKQQYGQTFSEVFATKRKAGRISLRRWQWQKAARGSVAMLIFLGKQYLGQTDRLTTSEDQPKGPLVIIRSSREEAARQQRLSEERDKLG